MTAAAYVRRNEQERAMRSRWVTALCVAIAAHVALVLTVVLAVVW